MTATATLVPTELDAAAAEGVAPMPADLIALREEFLALGERVDAINSRRDTIRSTFGKSLEDAGLQGYVLHGKVHARRSTVQTGRVDSKGLKDKMPLIWAQFIKVTSSVRVNIT